MAIMAVVVATTAALRLFDHRSFDHRFLRPFRRLTRVEGLRPSSVRSSRLPHPRGRHGAFLLFGWTVIAPRLRRAAVQSVRPTLSLSPTTNPGLERELQGHRRRADRRGLRAARQARQGRRRAAPSATTTTDCGAARRARHRLRAHYCRGGGERRRARSSVGDTATLLLSSRQARRPR